MQKRIELLLFFAGLALIVYGVGQIYRPLALIAAGVFAVAASLFSRIAK